MGKRRSLQLVTILAILLLWIVGGCGETPTPCPTAGSTATAVVCPTCVPTSTAVPSATPSATPTATPDNKPQVTCWDPKLSQLGLTIDYGENVNGCWRLMAAWITENGSWNDVPGCARQWQLDTLGGDHHAFGRAEWAAGVPHMGAGFVLIWPDGGAQRNPEPDGWANLPLGSNGFDWRVTQGPYSTYMFPSQGCTDKLVGLGLPYPLLPWQEGSIVALGGVHVSYFGVWQWKEK